MPPTAVSIANPGIPQPIAILDQDRAGNLAWMIASTDDETGEPYPDYDRFTFYSDADVPSICAHALQMIFHAATPKSAPTPAVTAIAKAPQNVTRIAPAAMPAPPTRAAIPPKSARKNSDVPDTR